MTGKHIGVWNESYGVLGMDCLRNYWVQLDFDSGKIRFLDPKNIDPAELGKAFRLSNLDHTYIHHSGLLEEGTSELLIDTGFNLDGVVNPKLFKRLIQEGKAQRVPVKVIGNVIGQVPELMSVPACMWAGETYTNLIVEAGHPNIIGIKFLARHVVTFNFPGRIMYLKPNHGETHDAQEIR